VRSKYDSNHIKNAEHVKPKRWSYVKPVFGFAALVVIGTTIWTTSVSYGTNDVFDNPRFTPFKIVNREMVTSTSIILTLRTSNDSMAKLLEDPYRDSWERGIWSVEIKQPELQIARSYTPLPPNEADLGSDIKLLIRKEHKGEMSAYIFSLPIQSKMQLRGRHPEFDIPHEVRDVIFLAGGTGIAPALQTAHTLLERRHADFDRPPNIHIIWATRRREDCLGGKELQDSDVPVASERTGPVVRELERLKRLFPERMTVEYLVDEERTFIDDKRIARWTNENVKTDTEDAASRLILISGPEGFVNTLAGPKIWQDGKELQGELGGILGKMGVQGWKIWKL
jgi:cytochrome-b5 reductase